MNRLIYWPLILIGILVALHLLVTGSPIPLWVIDKLNSPQAVSSIEDTGIKTTFGQIVPLPEAPYLRKYPAFSEDILKHGIEVTPSGEIYALLRIHHWCGNDPVRYHLARINLQSLCTLLELNPRQRYSTVGLDPGDLYMLNLSRAQLREMYSHPSRSPKPAQSPAFEPSKRDIGQIEAKTSLK